MHLPTCLTCPDAFLINNIEGNAECGGCFDKYVSLQARLYHFPMV